MNRQRSIKKIKKAQAYIFVSLFLSFQLSFFVMSATQVQAAYVDPGIINIDLPRKVSEIQESVSKSLLSGVLGSLVNMASYFMRTLAYDTASYVASGGKGQGSLIFEKPFGEYIAGVAANSVGEAIDSLGKGFGVNLCAPPDLRLQAQLKVGLDRIYNPVTAAGKSLGNTSGTSASGPQSSCSWQKLKENWSDGIDVGVDINVAADFASEVNVTETDFGYALSAFQQLDSLKATQEKAAELESLVGNGFKSVTDLVSGHVNTPAQQIQDETKALTAKHQGELSSQQIAGIYSSGLWQVIPTAASVFLNTLTSQLLNRLFTGGLVPSEKERGQGVADFYAINSVISQRQVAQRAFSFLTAKTGVKDPSEYDILAEFSVCPSSPGLNNCIMNNDMKTAIDRALIGKPLTLYDAVFKEGFISPNTPLISPRRTADNESLDCYKENLCYSNIQKMRKARIMPLGMEIAALRSDPDNPWTIGEVLQGFEKCPTLNVDGSITSDITNFPFCHLVNPNWILRAPDVRCENRVYSPELLVPESPRRHEDCVDISTCLTEDENGNCVGDKYYGFCTQEKNVWFFPGDTCESAFASCKAYTNQETRTIVSYLSRTLEYGSCNENAVGCLPYVTEKKAGTEEWKGTKDSIVGDKLSGAMQVLYLNDRITNRENTCPDTADGCTKFVGAERNSMTGAYIQDPAKAYIQDTTRLRSLKKAPNYLGCYDTTFTENSPEVNFPTTPLEIAVLTDDPRCDAYASVCLPEEVGCEAYTPAGGGEAVPGVVGDNFCPAACVGYDTFRQEKTNFESSEYPLYFIPANGTECSAQHVGCDEFTNIDDVSQGGEQLEYYSYIKQCEEPTGDNRSVYYSWEGSESTGFVLRVHTLAKVGSDYEFIPSSLQADFPPESPAYADDSSANLLENDGLCNETLYTNVLSGVPDAPRAFADCRALYDAKGVAYYRLLAETVTVSSACHPIRKTASRLVVSDDITSANTCLRKNGYWDGSSCQVCFGGGNWVAQDGNATQGSCVYYAIDAPGESVSCPASANECRAYTGNAGNNVRPVFESGTDTFEPLGDDADSLSQAKSAWSPADQVSIAAEALQVTFNSLRVNGGAAANSISRSLPAGAFESNTAYQLTFWARGTAQTLSISLQQGDDTRSLTTDPVTNTNLPISISQTWRAYTVGPVIFTGDATAPLDLVFQRAGASNGIYFLDNVSLLRTDENTNRIKNSWKTVEGYDAPAECFADSQNPRGPFPGAALGCQEYTTSLGQTVYATGFERLCREKAVGCAPLWDTFNSDSTEAEVYNARCISGTLTQTRYSRNPVTAATTCTITVESSEYTCSIAAGESSCVIPGPIRLSSDELITPLSAPGTGILVIKEGSASALHFDNPSFFAIVDKSSVYIPADTPFESPVFLTDTPEYICADKYLGCRVTGLEEQHTPDNASAVSYSYTDQGVINLPSTYLGDQGILCVQDQVACSAFTTSDGSTSYFKDPAVNANKLCVYQAPQTNNVDAPEGWFLKSVGHCSQDDAILCDSNAACGEGNTCVEIGESEPCYPTYQTNLESYGLWSNGSQQYSGYVGECPATQNLCTELVDPYDVDTSGKNPDGKPYYVIYDDQVTKNADECGGQASLREGCALFDNTEVPTKSYDTDATYGSSEQRAAKGDINTLVATVSTDKNDANVLLKVQRNRECSEWLACESYEPIQTGDGKQIFACESFARCIAFDGVGCSSWATDNGSTKPSNTFLNLDVYISRDTSWNGAEYTGYSLYNRFGLGDLKIIKFSQSERFSNAGVDADNGYLGYVLSDTYLTDNQGDTCLNATVGDVCGINGEGRCINTQCVVPADGAFDAKDTTLSNIATALGVAECKVPPEQDSPFSFDVIPLIENRDKHGFANNNVTTDLVRYTFSHRPAEVNVCQSGDCTCNYVAVSYGSLVKDYWASDTYHKKSSDISLWGICTGASETEGDYCREDNDCSFGTCQKIDRIETQIGSTGHCLEYDFSRKIFSPSSEPRYACLTWYPSDKSFGNVDTRNLFSAAGYDPAIDASTSSGDTGGQVYCTNSFGRSAGAYEGDGNLLIHQLYGGGSMKNAPGLPIAAYAYDSQSCAPLTIGPNSDNPFFKQKADGSIYLPESWSQVVGCSIDWFSKINTNPFAGYVCGALYAHSYSRSGNIDPSCGLTTIPEYTRKDSLNFLYNLMSGFGWEFIDKNAVVLRVEGDTSSEYSTTGGHHFGYWGKEDTYLVNALVPSMSIIAQMRDTQTLMHPPRFELTDGTFSFDNAVPVGTGGNFIGVKTDTLCLRAGGCPFYEDWPTLATETEGYLNIQALNSVYFIPLRSTAPYSSPVIFQPAILSKDLKIDFRGQLGTKPEVSILSAPDMVGIPVGPDATTKSTKTAVTSYKLERDTASNIPCDGLVSFCSYSGGSDLGQGEKYTYTPSNTANTDDAVAFIQSKRNEVATRYVVVYYPQEQNLLPSFVKNSPSEKFTKPTSIETDPFSAQCVFAVGSTVKTDYFAIGMDFNKDGEFLGYISRNCGYYGMQMAVIATMKDQCSEFVSVYRNVDPTTESNKAWTNRVWKGTQYTLKASYTAQVSQDAQHPPFGSSPFTEQDITTDGADYRAQAALLASVFTNSKFGYPFFCYPGNIASRSVFGDTSRCASLVDDGFDANTVEAFSVFSNKVMGGGYFDGPFIHPFNGEELLSRLFAKYYVKNVFPFDTAVSLDSQHGDLYYTDPDMIEGAHLQYPQIYSLNPITCFPRESAINCSVAKENAFSIGEADNEQYIGKGTYSAKARFFAFADDNRMPIRRVMIDWDDGDTTNKGVFGMYKNKKPYCEPSDTPPTETSLGYCRNQATREFTLVTCQQDLDCPTDGEYHCLHTWSNTPEDVQYGIDEQVGGAEFVAPRFGNMPRACDAKPFEYYHAYGCDNPTQTISMVRDQLTDITYNKLIESGLNDGSKICVYQPKVQVLDNWGYCNGSCNGAGNTGCYNDDGIGGILECDAPDYSTLHWTPYQGIIVIIP